MSADTITIKAIDLRRGMVVYRQARGGQWKIDFQIGEPFTTSGPDRLQPEAWNTTNGIKVFAHCADVVIGTGRKVENTDEASKVIGSAKGTRATAVAKQQRANSSARRKNRKAAAKPQDRKVGVR